MSKKTKAPAKKKKPARKAARPAARKAATRVSAATRRTAAATIFVYTADGQTRVRTSPQYISGGPGWVEWTVVNLADGNNGVPVTISWPNGGPWGSDPIAITKGSVRLNLAGAKDGRYKYTVSAGGASEDPEIEIPEN